MAKILGLLTATLLAFPVAGAQNTPATVTHADDALIANERALYDAAAKADKAAFVSLVLPDGVWTSGRGFIPVKLLAGELRAFNLTKWDIVNPRVTWLGNDSAVVVYTLQASGTFEGRDVAQMAFASTVWTRRDGKWVAAHHQETDLVKY